MEDIVNELKSILNNLLKQQERDIVTDVLKQSPINIGKKSTAEFLNDLKLAYPSIYNRSLHKVLHSNVRRAKTIAILVDLTELLSTDLDREILDFEALRDAFDYIHLNANTELAIFVHIIKSNAFLHELYNYPIREANIEAIANYNFKHLTKEQVNDIIMHIGIDTFISEQYNAPKEAKKELLQVYEKTSIDYSERQALIQQLHDIFKKKTVDLTEDDFSLIKELMSKLLFGKLSHRVVKQMQKMQASAQKDACAIVKLIVESSKNNKDDNSSKNISPKLNPKELNQIYYAISKVYDLDKEKPKRILSLDEIIYILSLMYKAHMESKVITNFLKSTAREYRKQNPFCIYYQSYNKFKSYELVELQEHLDMIEYILSEVNIFICSEDEYCETKELVQGELDIIMQILKDNYTYEVNEAKSLLKINEE